MLIDLTNEERAFLCSLTTYAAIDGEAFRPMCVSLTIKIMMGQGPLENLDQDIQEAMRAQADPRPIIPTKNRGGRPKGARNKAKEADSGENMTGDENSPAVTNKTHIEAPAQTIPEIVQETNPAESASYQAPAGGFFDHTNGQHKMLMVEAINSYEGDRGAIREGWKPWIMKNTCEATIESLHRAFDRCVDDADVAAT